MAPLIGVIGSLQAMEAMKLLAGYGKPASGKIVKYDVMTCQFREIDTTAHSGVRGVWENRHLQAG
ncbi:ThiF family adenylyltransferase [Escherichia coli]